MRIFCLAKVLKVLKLCMLFLFPPWIGLVTKQLKRSVLLVNRHTVFHKIGYCIGPKCPWRKDRIVVFGDCLLVNGCLWWTVSAYILNVHNYYLGCRFFLEVLCLGQIFKKRGISKSVSYLTREFDNFSFPKDAAEELEVYHQWNALWCIKQK